LYVILNFNFFLLFSYFPQLWTHQCAHLYFLHYGNLFGIQWLHSLFDVQKCPHKWSFASSWQHWRPYEGN
jgi:hypothetical protein